MTKESFRSLVKAFAVVSVVVGGLGSIACVPYAFTSNLYLLTATGIYFIAGGIMITGGLIATSLMIKSEE